ncbi:MAG TPA: M1 family metallopeptidase [Candidatus Limnocylindria bacterium]|nr:M1 family metallopeptidase [Candidatus Limnocylindria bacterium]
MNDFRLRRDVRPVHYELHFELDLERWSSRGDGTITLRNDAPVREVVLHSLDLDITRALLDGAASTGIAYDIESQTAALSFAAEVEPGVHTLALEWSGEIREALRGLYRSTRGEERYAATQFEAADARRAFPCFDEPEFKATWGLTLTHATALAAVANAPIATQRDLGGGRTRTTFARMPKISSYLFAFTVGPYEATPVATTRTGVPTRVWVPPGLARSGLYARDAHVAALEWLEDYTAIPYPYTKVDAIGLPDFEAGAMENPGAITYRTTYLAADEKTASIAQLKATFSVAAHELTHMWWGDLVTMKWWTDIWLNESFASFVGEKATKALHPEWGYERDIVAQNTSAFNLDSLASTHAISVEAKSADEASERFDAVTYLKGQGVLRMIENFIGEDAFREGVRLYLDRYREGNAEAEDFWRALDESSGRDVSGIANAWIKEPGHPLVSCGVLETDGGLELRLGQQRFFADPGRAATTQRWPVPLVIRYGAGDTIAEQRVLFDGEAMTVSLPRASWYYPNGGGTGFYRTSFDDRSIALLSRAISQLAPEERFALLDNAWALSRASKATVGQVLELISGLEGEDDRAVLQQIADIFSWLSAHAVRPDTEAGFRALVERIFRPQYQRLGWDVRPDDSADEREKRSTVLFMLGSLAAAADVRKEARRRADAHLAGQRAHPDVARATLGVAAAEGEAALYDRYVAAMKEAAKTDAVEESRLRASLTDFEDPQVVRRFSADLYTDLIRDQDRSLLVQRLLALRHAREEAWKALKDHWEPFATTTDPANKQRYVTAASQLSPRRLADEVVTFLASKQTPDLKETAAQATERVRILAANAERMARELGEALSKGARSGQAEPARTSG